MNRVLLLMFFALGFSLQAGAQSSARLALQSTRHPHQFKKLPLNYEYTLQMVNDTFYSVKILDYSDTELKLFGRTKTGRDSLFRESFRDKATKKWKDSLVLSPIYHDDTFHVAISDIRMIRRDWFRNRGWMLPFAYFAGGALLGIVLAPVALINKGKQGLHDWLAFEAVLIGLSGPTLFIGSREHKYDLQQKWKLVVRQE